VASGFACWPPYALTPGQPPPGTATLLRLSIGLPTAGSVQMLTSPEGSDRSLSITRFSMDDSVPTQVPLYGGLLVVASDLTTISAMPNYRRAAFGWRPTEDHHVPRAWKTCQAPAYPACP
jgi:hypothetical protein